MFCCWDTDRRLPGWMNGLVGAALPFFVALLPPLEITFLLRYSDSFPLLYIAYMVP